MAKRLCVDLKPGIIIGETFRRSLCLRVEKGGPYFFEVKVLGIKLAAGAKKRHTEEGPPMKMERSRRLGVQKHRSFNQKIQKSAHKKIPPTPIFCVDNRVRLTSVLLCDIHNQERRFSRRQSEERRKKREVCIARARFLCRRFWGAFVFVSRDDDDWATFENEKSDLWKRIRYSRAVLRHWGRAVERCEWKMHRL